MFKWFKDNLKKKKKSLNVQNALHGIKDFAKDHLLMYSVRLKILRRFQTRSTGDTRGMLEITLQRFICISFLKSV